MVAPGVGLAAGEFRGGKGAGFPSRWDWKWGRGGLHFPGRLAVVPAGAGGGKEAAGAAGCRSPFRVLHASKGGLIPLCRGELVPCQVRLLLGPLSCCALSGSVADTSQAKPAPLFCLFGRRKWREPQFLIFLYFHTPWRPPSLSWWFRGCPWLDASEDVLCVLA